MISGKQVGDKVSNGQKKTRNQFPDPAFLNDWLDQLS